MLFVPVYDRRYLIVTIAFFLNLIYNFILKKLATSARMCVCIYSIDIYIHIFRDVKIYVCI